ncbi:MAG: RQC domain-containing protein, partial [Pseudomonadota bacterium]|nr:RQC domain-containing protein [Pseudomonadota bacterium]
RHFVDQVSDEEQKRIENFKLSNMVAFSEALNCRRNVLLNYFGESSQKPCGNCDVCLNPPKVFDAKIAAQKVLSCVYRLNQGFGLKYVVDILRGAKQEKILNAGHDALSTYGVGKEFSSDEWQSIIRQLIHLGYIYQDVQNYSVLKFTELSGDLLKGKVELQLALPKKPASASGKTSRPANKAGADDLLDNDRIIFDKLRALRKEIAESEDVPPYVVFSNATLVEMAKARPQNDYELIKINGVGESKLARYGFEFLDFLRKHPR